VDQMSRLTDMPTVDSSLSTMSQHLDETDLDAFLESQFESRLMGVLEEMQERVREESGRVGKGAKAAGWERVKRLYLDKRQLLFSKDSAPSFGLPTSDSTGPSALRRRERPLPSLAPGNTKPAHMLSAIQSLNASRLSDTPFAPALAFREVALGASEHVHGHDLLPDCWEALAHIAGEHDKSKDLNVFLKKEEQTTWGKEYRGKSSEWRKNLVKASRTFLQSTFSRHLDATLAQYPREARLGGRPSAAERARAYAGIRVQRMGQGEVQRLDMVGSLDGSPAVPYWMVLWTLVRQGMAEEALEYAGSGQVSSFIERQEPAFLAYLKAYTQGTMSSSVLQQLRSDYAQRSTSPLSHDPYKLALLKVMGKCDVSRSRSLPDVVQTSEDYLWLQLCLLNENGDGQDSLYALEDLQAAVTGYGPQHFDPKGTAPLRYFQVLLLVGLFEPAIAHLHQSAAYQIEVIHFAVSLVYHGLLAVPSDPTANAWDLAIPSDDKKSGPLINYGMLVGQYARQMGSAFDVPAGLQYVFLLSLVDWHPAYLNACRQLVREAVLESSSSAASLLGDGSSDGFLPRHAKLLGLSNSKDGDFMTEITVRAGEACEREDRLADALQLFNLSGEYTRVVNLLTRKLSHGLRSVYQHDSDLPATALAILQYYRGQEKIKSTLPAILIQALEALLALTELRSAVEHQDWSRTAHILTSTSQLTDMFPLDASADPSIITRAADRLRSGAMPEPMSGCLPESLLLLMRALHGRFQSLRSTTTANGQSSTNGGFVDAGRQAEMDRIRRQGRALMLMVGLVRVRIPSEACAQLTRLDIMMN